MYAVAISPSKMETSMKKVPSSFTVPFGKIAYNIQKILSSIFGDKYCWGQEIKDFSKL